MSFSCFCYNIQHLGDLNHLSGCHINITDLFTRFQFNVNTLQCFLCILVHFCPSYKSCFGVLFLTAKVNVLGNCKICYQGLLLEYHSDALLIRIDNGCCYIRLTHVKHLSHGRSLNTTPLWIFISISCKTVLDPYVLPTPFVSNKTSPICIPPFTSLQSFCYALL